MFFTIGRRLAQVFGVSGLPYVLLPLIITDKFKAVLASPCLWVWFFWQGRGGLDLKGGRRTIRRATEFLTLHRPRRRRRLWRAGHLRSALSDITDLRGTGWFVGQRVWRAIGAACVRSLAAQRGRSILFAPVALGAGIATYFSLPTETAGTVSALPWFVVLLGLGLYLRSLRSTAKDKNRVLLSVASAVLVAASVFALGFLLADLRTARVHTPVLEKQLWGVTFVGRVVSSEQRRTGNRTGARLVLDLPQIEGLAADKTPKRIRITARGSEPPKPGLWLTGRATLSPPFAPRTAGDPDLARRDYFRGIGAIGYTMGAIHPIAPPAGASSTGLVDAWGLFWHDLRRRIADRITPHLPADRGGLAAALLAGARDRLPLESIEAMRIAGVAHLLAISGLHVGFVTGTVYLWLRIAMACLPSIALRYQTHKTSLAVAFVAGLLYFFLAGATLPTQRAILMFALFAIAIFMDRHAISLRLVAWSALVILLVTPESLLSVGFQMSFASVTVLIAAWEARRARRLRIERSLPEAALWHGPIQLPSLPFRLLRRGRFYLMEILVTTFLATVAVLPLSLYHFGRSATFGLLANCIAIPATGLLVVPLGLAALLAMPFGLEGFFLRLMEPGLAAILDSSSWIAALPAAQLQAVEGAAWSFPPLIIGGLWLLLLRGRVRLFGLIGVALFAFAWLTPRSPVLFVSADGRSLAVLVQQEAEQGAQPILYASQPRSWGTKVWRERLGGIASASFATATQPMPQDNAQADWLACDDTGCIFQRSEESTALRLAILWRVEAIARDCAFADLVVFPHHWSDNALCNLSDNPQFAERGTGGAKATPFVLDKRALLRSGGITLTPSPRSTGKGEPAGFTLTSTCESLGDRPWYGSLCARYFREPKDLKDQR